LWQKKKKKKKKKEKLTQWVIEQKCSIKKQAQITLQRRHGLH
jgi:hypothetical protein